MHRSATVCSLFVFLVSSRVAAQADITNDSVPVCDEGSQWNPELQICVDESTRPRHRDDAVPDERRACHRLRGQSERQEADGNRLEAAESLVELYSDHRDECEQFDEHDQCEVLFQAGVLFEREDRLGPAIQIWRRLFAECGDDSDYAAPDSVGTIRESWTCRDLVDRPRVLRESEGLGPVPRPRAI